MPSTPCSAAPTAGRSSRASWAHCSEGWQQCHPCPCCGTRADRGGVRPRGRNSRAYAEYDRARHLFGDVERALLVQIIEGLAQDLADHGAARHLRPRRERRRCRHRRRRRGRVQNREPQSPLLHRAPSGAATGVGGILRDVFTMGARPIAILDSLRFGSPDHGRTRHLVSAVVSGIGGYGNCVGVPTVGGECEFHTSYDGNILVNAMCVGIARVDRIFYSAAAGPGNPVIYVGAKTGRDGIHGATMASAEFGADAGEKRPTVQVGDPFTEKLLIEACLELMEGEAIVAIQDMGAAGLTSSSVEMAGKGGLGIELDLDHVPLREAGMSAYEIMLSESQERMLMILRPGSEAEARHIFQKWELDFAVIGRVTETGRLV